MIDIKIGWYPSDAVESIQESYKDHPHVYETYEAAVYDDDGEETDESIIVVTIDSKLDFMVIGHIKHLAKPFDIEFEII